MSSWFYLRWLFWLIGGLALGWGIYTVLTFGLEWHLLRAAHRQKQLRLLRRLNAQFQSTMPYQEIIQRLLQAMVTDLGFSLARLALLEDGRLMVYAPPHHSADEAGGTPVFLAAVDLESDNPMARVVRSGQVLVSGRAGGKHRGVFVPLQAQNMVMGVLMGVSGPEEPEEEQIELLKMIAAQAGLAIANARNYAFSQACQAELLQRERELAEAEEHLIQTVRLSALGELSLSVAHELNNPLTVILGLIQLARRRTNLTPNVSQSLLVMEEAAQRCRTIIADLLLHANWENPQRVVLDINEVIHRVVAMLTPELAAAGVECHLFLTEEPVKVFANKEQMEEVLINLLTNAKEAMNQGGLILIKTRATGEGDRWEISIKDTGSGIPPEIIDKIFDPFFTTKKEAGTGLGLAICQEVLRRHQGTIEVFSRVGEGTEFVISLPRCRGEVRA